MPSYKFTAHAQKDLQNIVDYTVNNWGDAQADKYIDGLVELITSLANNPALGARHDELKNGLLGFPYKSHKIYYTRTKAGIIISRVLHQHQNFEKML